MRRLAGWIVASLLGLSLALPVAQGQPPPAPPVVPAPEGGNQGEVSAVPWAVAAVFTLVILLVVCMPSRKS